MKAVWLLFLKLAIPMFLSAAVPGFPAPGTDTFSLRLDLETEAAGTSGGSLGVMVPCPIGGMRLKPFGGIRYGSVGNLSFVQSDDYAYRDPTPVLVHDLGAECGLFLEAGAILAGAKCRMRWLSVAGDVTGGWEEAGLIAGFRAGPVLMTLEAGFGPETVRAEAGVLAPVFLAPFPVQAGVALKWNENLVLCVGIGAGNPDTGLELSLEYPQGLILPCDTLIAFGLRKRFGDWEWGLTARPSVSGNDRYGTSVSWFPAFN